MISELSKQKIDKRDYFNLILLGVFSQSSLILVFYGLKFTTSLDNAVISVLSPIMTVAAGHYFYNEKVSKFTKVGLFVATLGTLLTAIEPIFEDGGSQVVYRRLLGNFLVLLYNMMFLLYIVWSKMSMGEKSPLLKKTLSFIHIRPMRRKYTPTLITFFSFFVGLVSMFPFAYMENFGMLGGFQFNAHAIPATAVFGLLYMVFLSSIAAYLLFEWGIEHASVTSSAILGYLGPVFTLPFAFWMLGEVPGYLMLCGILVISSGVLIAEYKNGGRI
jgi:drug/metabolite transporter (DMT)-like permease